MAFPMANFGLSQISTPSSLPFGAGSVPLNNNLYQPAFTSANLNQIPWQQNNQLGSPGQQNHQQDSLWQLLQQNKRQLDNPFGQQNTQNNNIQGMQQQQFPWFQDNNDDNQGNKNHSQEQDWFKQLQSKDQNNNASKDDKDSKEKEELEELHEQFEEWLEKDEEQRKETYNDFQLLVLMLYPFLIFERPVAVYFAAAELLSTVLTKYGINDEDNLLFMLFVQCLDIVALSRGRLRLVDGYKDNWYQELFDYSMTKLGVSDIIRIGSQLGMPQSPAPEYEIK